MVHAERHGYSGEMERGMAAANQFANRELLPWLQIDTAYKLQNMKLSTRELHSVQAWSRVNDVQFYQPRGVTYPYPAVYFAGKSDQFSQNGLPGVNILVQAWDLSRQGPVRTNLFHSHQGKNDSSLTFLFLPNKQQTGEQIRRWTLSGEGVVYEPQNRGEKIIQKQNEETARGRELVTYTYVSLGQLPSAHSYEVYGLLPQSTRHDGNAPAFHPWLKKALAWGGSV